MPTSVTWGLEFWEGLDVIPYGGLNNVDTLGIFFDEKGKLLSFLMEQAFSSVEVSDSIVFGNEDIAFSGTFSVRIVDSVALFDTSSSVIASNAIANDLITISDQLEVDIAKFASASDSISIAEVTDPRLALIADLVDLVIITDQLGTSTISIEVEDSFSFINEDTETAQGITIDDILGNIKDNILTSIADRLLPTIAKIQRTE